jgi:hypothetical protein
MNADKASILYYAIKTHYTSKQYNAVTYNFHVRVKQIPANQYYVFDKLARKYKNELKYFYISTLFENPKVWIGDLLSQDAEDVFMNWKKRMQSLSSCFKNEICELLTEYELKELIICKNSYPILLRKVLQEKTSVDTLLILDGVIQFFDRWDKCMENDMVWEENRDRYFKYRSFMNYDIDRMKKILIREVKMR